MVSNKFSLNFFGILMDIIHVVWRQMYSFICVILYHIFIFALLF